MFRLVDLPNETLQQVFDNASATEKAALCLVCKRFNVLAIISLYRQCAFSDIERLLAFCWTVAINNTAALAVREFTLAKAE